MPTVIGEKPSSSPLILPGDNTSAAEPITVAPSIMVLDQDTGRWVEKKVAAAGDMEMIYDPLDDFDTDPTNIDKEWAESGRGAMMEYRWLHRDPKYSARERSQGYAPVDPKMFRTSRYPATNIPGVGNCYAYGDIFLCEIPRAVAEKRRANYNETMKREQFERKYGFANSGKDIARATGSQHVKAMEDSTEIESYFERGNTRINPAMAEVESINRAFDFAQQQADRAKARR